MTILFTIVFRGDRCITAGQTRCSLIRKTVTCCAPRERKNQIFWLFWRRVSNHWINPHNRRTNDPFPNLLPPFFLSSFCFFFCARSCAISSSYVTEFRLKTRRYHHNDYYTVIFLWIFGGEREENRSTIWNWNFHEDGKKKIRWRFKICNLMNYFFFYNWK